MSHQDPTPLILRRVCEFTRRVVDKGRNSGNTLVSVPGDLVEDLRDASMQLVTNYSCIRVSGILEQLESRRPAFWPEALVLHAWAVRDFAALQRGADGFERTAQLNKSLALLSVTPNLMVASNALLPPSKVSEGILTWMLKSDLFACYAAVFAAFKDLPPSGLNDYLALFSLLLMVMSQIGIAVTGVGTKDIPLLALMVSPASALRLQLYREWMAVLASSSLLEHSAQAFLQLEALVQVAVTAGNCDFSFVRQRLVEMTWRLSNLVYSTMHPYLKQPILSLCQWPLCTPSSEANSILLAVQGKLRTVLSGTCLQFWLGKELTEARLALTGSARKTFGIPTALLLPASIRSAFGPIFIRLMDVCSTVWQVTVSGPLPHTPKLALDSQLLAEDFMDTPLLDSMPYSAVNVYDMVHEVMCCITENLPEYERHKRVDHVVYTSMCLLVRLVSELEPRHATRRLPYLWHLVSKLTPTLCLRRPSLSHNYFWLLLTLLQMHPASEDVHGASGGANGAWVHCALNLRCALDSGFVPTVEQILRHHGRLVLMSPDAMFVCLGLLNIILRNSGVWPAFLAYGSEKEVASLIITLGKVARVFRDIDNEPLSPATQFTMHLVALIEQAVAVILRPWNLPAAPVRNATIPLADISRPTSTNPKQHRSGKGSSLAGGSSGNSSSNTQLKALDAAGSAGSCGGGSTAAAVAMTKLKLLDLGNALETDTKHHLTVEWLEHVGGRTQPSSTITKQQWLAVLALTQWMPLTMTLWSPSMDRAVARGVLSVALQCMKASNNLLAAQEAAGQQELRLGPSPEQVERQRYLSWCNLLVERMDVVGWLAHRLGLPNCMQRDFPHLVPDALDVLEVLAVTLPPMDLLMRMYVPVRRNTGPARQILRTSEKSGKGKQGTDAAGGGGRGGDGGASSRSAVDSASSPILIPSVDGIRIKEALMLRYGRRNLMTMLQDAQSNMAFAIWMNAGSRSEADAEMPLTMLTLRAELEVKYDLERLHELPTPDEAERATAAIGVKCCSNARCNTLAGTQESELELWRCARCKVVSYCSVECQREHWAAGHKEECKSSMG